MAKNSSANAMFTEAMYNVQTHLGSRDKIAGFEARGKWTADITTDVAQFIASQGSFFLGTATAGGQPYIQHRGGEAGFIKVVGTKILEFPDYAGNRHFMTLGNLSENPSAFIFMIDYETATRVKFWGSAEIIGLETQARTIRFTIDAWDVNCKKHIPPLIGPAAYKLLIDRVRELEGELARLQDASNTNRH